MQWIEPMKPILTKDVKQGSEWSHEVKWDGIRGMFYINDGGLKIFTLKGNDRSGYYPELSSITKCSNLTSAILDGEIVVLDENGKPNFYSSLIRERIKNPLKIQQYSKIYPTKYIIFDILYANGKKLTDLPLEERRDILQSGVENTESIIVNKIFENGSALFNEMKLRNWEGIVSKKNTSTYVGGKNHSSWFKTKLSKKMLSVIGGLSWKDQFPNSLLLGIYKANSLVYIGKVSSGLTDSHIRLLKENTSQLHQTECPFVDPNNPELKGNNTWLRPAITCWTGFFEFTGDGIMRHPKLIGFTTLPPEQANGQELIE